VITELGNRRKIKAVIFDLDDTLYDCSGTLSKNRRKEIVKVVMKHRNCSEEEAAEVLQKDEDVRKYGRYEGLASRLGLPPAFLEEIRTTLQKSPDLNQIKLFPDVSPTLNELRGQGLKLFLVTSGNYEEQEAKVKHLKLSASDGLIDEVMIVKRDGEGTAKGRCFQHLLEKYSLEPGEVLCVGDRIEDELSAAKALGIQTAILKHGQHYERFANSPHREMLPDFFINSPGDLVSLIQALGNRD
jgi:putative hydrolase of the HAD superfamily